jgi:2-oxoglutarate dehydrogenase E2 component (dihydrolipoamide succinyltransferase)
MDATALMKSIDQQLARQGALLQAMADKMGVKAPMSEAAGPPPSRADLKAKSGPGVPRDASSEASDVVVSPAAAKLAKEAGIDAASLEGSGKGGIVTKKDVEMAIEAAEA